MFPLKEKDWNKAVEKKLKESWFDEGHNMYVLPRQSESIDLVRLAKYWAAKEMAASICKNYEELIDEDLYIFSHITKFLHRSCLTQILKREWFR